MADKLSSPRAITPAIDINALCVPFLVTSRSRSPSDCYCKRICIILISMMLQFADLLFSIFSRAHSFISLYWGYAWASSSRMHAICEPKRHGVRGRHAENRIVHRELTPTKQSLHQMNCCATIGRRRSTTFTSKPIALAKEVRETHCQ